MELHVGQCYYAEGEGIMYLKQRDKAKRGDHSLGNKVVRGWEQKRISIVTVWDFSCQEKKPVSNMLWRLMGRKVLVVQN